MAKIDSFFNFEGTFNGTTRVRSKTYKEHIRRARGTVTTAEVNDAFKQSGNRLVTANGYSKLIKDCLEPYRSNFKDGTLWMRLNSLFRSQLKKGTNIDFRELEGFELFKKHPLWRVANLRVDASYDVAGSVIHLTVKCLTPPVFKRNKKSNSCRFTAIGVFIDDDNTFATSTASELCFPTLSATTMNFVLPVPQETGTVLICVKCEGCVDGITSEVLNTKGMSIVRAVRLEDLIVKKAGENPAGKGEEVLD